MNLEDLVPPMELCEQIPEGKFEDSACVWCGDQFFEHITVVPRTYSGVQRDGDIAPAPTLAEIMLALDEAGFFSPTCYRKANTWCVDCEDDPIDEDASKLPCLFDAEDNDNSATAALRLWLSVTSDKSDKSITQKEQ